MYIILKRYKGCLLAFASCSYTERNANPARGKDEKYVPGIRVT